MRCHCALLEMLTAFGNIYHLGPFFTLTLFGPEFQAFLVWFQTDEIWSFHFSLSSSFVV